MKIRIYHNPMKRIEQYDTPVTSFRQSRGGCTLNSLALIAVWRRYSREPIENFKILGLRIVRNSK